MLCVLTATMISSAAGGLFSKPISK